MSEEKQSLEFCAMTDVAPEESGLESLRVVMKASRNDLVLALRWIQTLDARIDLDLEWRFELPNSLEIQLQVGQRRRSVVIGFRIANDCRAQQNERAIRRRLPGFGRVEALR